MAFRNEAFNALVAAVGAALPTVATNGIYRARQFARLPLQTKAEAGELPVAVIDWNPREGTEWGLVNTVDDGTCAVYLINRDTGDDVLPDAAEDEAETLREWLLSNALDYGQIIGAPWISDSIDLPPNRHFIGQARPYFACGVLFRYIAGESP
jgi:hypothetical protein